MDLEKIFTTYYYKNTFGSIESVSGEGSMLKNTHWLRVNLEWLMEKYSIETILDAPCGDYNWMRFLKYNFRNYCGVDIVDEIIQNNREKYLQSNREFSRLDLAKDKLPKADIILCRDLLVHLDFKSAMQVLKNFKKSDSTYLLITTFTNREKNIELTSGMIWRVLNMQKNPFLFPEPIETINEHCTEGYGRFFDKSLAMWKLSDLEV